MIVSMDLSLAVWQYLWSTIIGSLKVLQSVSSIVYSLTNMHQECFADHCWITDKTYHNRNKEKQKWNVSIGIYLKESAHNEHKKCEDNM